MAVITRNVGSFKKTSTNGATVYGTTYSFDMPAFASIEEVKVSFTTHGSSGSTQDRAFLINGTRAHANNAWAVSNLVLNAGLIVAGNNTFRVTLKAQAGLNCSWDIGSESVPIVLTISYTPPVSNPGNITLNKNSMAAGETVAVSMSAADAGVTRKIEVFFGSESTAMATIVTGAGSGAANYDYTFPLARCDKMPNATSGTIRVVMTGSVGSPVTKTMSITVPASAVPTMGNFTAARQANGVDPSITEFAQNYSGVSLAIASAAGVYGSSIAKYEIFGGGFAKDASTAIFSPLPNAGEIVFTARVTDTRGRTVTKTVTITVVAYAKPSLTGASAIRSNAAGAAADEGAYAALLAKMVFSSINGKNAATLRGRVYEKGTTAPGWTAMTDNVIKVLGGALLFNKAYTAQIQISDKVSDYTYTAEIGTAVIGMNILPGAAGASFGGYAVPGLFKTLWPAIAPACPRVGDIIMSAVNNSPALTWPGTVWTALGGRFLIGADATYTAGSVGGAATHTLTAAEMPTHKHDSRPAYGGSGALLLTNTPNNGKLMGAASDAGKVTEITRESDGDGPVLPAGGGGAHNNMPPYLAVYMWQRAA